MKKALLALLFIAIIICVYFFTPARHYLSQEGFVALQTWIHKQGVLAPFIFGLIYIGGTILAVPGSVMTIGGGILFGVGWGTLINLISATIGASLAFLIARYLGRGFVERYLKGRFARLDDKVAQHGFSTVFVLRLIALFPFNLLNYSLGLTKVRFGPYFLATLIGMAPVCFIYTSLGGIGKHISLTDPKTWMDYRVWGPFALVILLTVITKIVQGWQRKRAT